jgi:RNA polymerase sigma factor (sigma-70 family)
MVWRSQTVKKVMPQTSSAPAANFEKDALAHLNSVYNLARQLTSNAQDAEDVVKEVYLRASKSYHRFRGGDARSWLLKIARNVCYTRLLQNPPDQSISFEEELLDSDAQFQDREDAAAQSTSGALLQKALRVLPTHCREVLVLRELEGMSYREIATILGVPEGSVMLRLSRARTYLRESMTNALSAKAGKSAAK